MSKKVLKGKVWFLILLYSSIMQNGYSQNDAKHSIYFGFNPYTYVFNENLGGWNSGHSWSMQPSFVYKYYINPKDAVYFKHISMLWGTKEPIGMDTTFLFEKKIYSNTLGYIRDVNVTSWMRLGAGAGISYNRLENIFYGNFLGHYALDGYYRNTFGVESTLESSLRMFKGFWIVPSFQYYLPLFERNKHIPFDLKHEQYMNFVLFLKFDF